MTAVEQGEGHEPPSQALGQLRVEIENWIAIVDDTVEAGKEFQSVLDNHRVRIRIPGPETPGGFKEVEASGIARVCDFRQELRTDFPEIYTGKAFAIIELEKLEDGRCYLPPGSLTRKYYFVGYERPDLHTLLLSSDVRTAKITFCNYCNTTSHTRPDCDRSAPCWKCNSQAHHFSKCPEPLTQQGTA